MTDHDVASMVGRRITALRKSTGLSLSELARRAGLGKGTLSELESGRRNPTLETLYALTAPLGVGLARLIDTGDPASGPRGMAAGDGVTAVLLDVLGEFPRSTTEVYRLVVDPGGLRVSPAHGIGVCEQLTVVSGVAVVGRIGAEVRVGQGETTTWISDTSHSFSADGDEPAVGVLLITHPDARDAVPDARDVMPDPRETITGEGISMPGGTGTEVERATRIELA